MWLANLVPTKHLWDFDPDNDFSFIEAHPFLESSEYRSYFCAQIEQGKRDLVILDSSVTKLGAPLPNDKILEAASIIDNLKPKPRRFEIVVPDIVGDFEASMELFKSFLVDFRESLIDATLMCVPQGSSEDTWFSSCMEMIQPPEVGCVGIAYKINFDVDVVQRVGPPPQTANDWMMRRLSLTRMLEEEGHIDVMCDYHLLGSGNPWELSEQRLHPWIRSTDTSSAFKHGSRGMRFDPEEGVLERVEAPMQFGEEHPINRPCTLANMRQMWEWLGRDDKIRKRRAR